MFLCGKMLFLSNLSVSSVDDLSFQPHSIEKFSLKTTFIKWAASWQNQQSECAPSEDSDQPGHLPSLIRVFTVRMKKPWVLSYPLSAQQRLWSDWEDAQADLSLCWAHSHIVGFVTRRLKFCILMFFCGYVSNKKNIHMNQNIIHLIISDLKHGEKKCGQPKLLL